LKSLIKLTFVFVQSRISSGFIQSNVISTLHLSVRTHPKFSTFLNCFGRQARYSIRRQNVDPRNSCFCHTSRTSRVYCRPSAAGLYDSNNNRRGAPWE